MSTGVEVEVQKPPVSGVEQASRALDYATGYSVSEEAIAVDPTDTTGATGVISVDIDNSRSRTSAKRMSRSTITLSDKGQGTTSGIVRVPSGNLSSTKLTADQRLVILTSVRVAKPFSGTLREYLIYLFSLVGIVDGFVIDEAFGQKTVVFPGWRDDVYLQIKRILIPRGGEITLASGNIVVRPIRGRITVDRRDTEFSWSMDDSGLALSVEGYWYENRSRSQFLAYPPGGWNEDVQVYQVDAGETIELPVSIEASLSSVNQPIAVNGVSREYEGPNSVYSVVGADGKPVPAKQWTDAGGSLSVEIGEDTRSLVIRITGAQIPRYAPFRIAMAAGTSDTYSSLRITGAGVFFTKHGPITLYTSATEDQTSVEVGATLDSEFVTNRSTLYDALAWSLSRYGGARHSINVRTTGINRIDESGSYDYPTFEDFNDDARLRRLETFEDANEAYAGYTIEQFNVEWARRSTESFANQAFGNVVGARTFRDGLWFRIRTSEISPAGISYTAENDTTVQDFNEWVLEQLELRGLPNTFESVNALFAGRGSIAEFSAAPLTLED